MVAAVANDAGAKVLAAAGERLDRFFSRHILVGTRSQLGLLIPGAVRRPAMSVRRDGRRQGRGPAIGVG